MDENSFSRRSIGRYALCLGLGAAALTVAGQAMAGCGMYGAQGALPPSWSPSTAAASTSAAKSIGRPGEDHGAQAGSIVGLWKFTFVSDGTAYPAQIPAGVVLDFGTAIWHSDGTEITFSGGRPPSSGDVCMGVWEQTGRATFRLKHIALGWVSSDTPPPVGPVSPAAFVGPAIIRQTVKVGPSGHTFQGTLTIDQFASDEVTLLEHIGGTVTATRVTPD